MHQVGCAIAHEHHVADNKFGCTGHETIQGEGMDHWIHIKDESEQGGGFKFCCCMHVTRTWRMVFWCEHAQNHHLMAEPLFSNVCNFDVLSIDINDAKMLHLGSQVGLRV